MNTVKKGVIRINRFSDVELARGCERELAGLDNCPHLPKDKIPGILNVNALRSDQCLHTIFPSKSIVKGALHSVKPQNTTTAYSDQIVTISVDMLRMYEECVCEQIDVHLSKYDEYLMTIRPKLTEQFMKIC
jgi:hypothetical protein